MGFEWLCSESKEALHPNVIVGWAINCTSQLTGFSRVVVAAHRCSAQAILIAAEAFTQGARKLFAEAPRVEAYLRVELVLCLRRHSFDDSNPEADDI